MENQLPNVNYTTNINYSTNLTNFAPPDPNTFEYNLWQKILFSCFMFPIMFFSIVGNILVIIAIVKNESLHKISNTFLASLAIADCSVGILAMPPNAIQLLSGKWYFKSQFCKFWFSCDVLFSTASILHLCCIAIDRYLSVSDKYVYSYVREDPTGTRVKLMIGGCWITSALLSFIPIFTGIYTTQEQWQAIHQLDHENGYCAFKVNLPYRFISSVISFWLPCFGLIAFYSLVCIKAYKIEKKHQREYTSKSEHRKSKSESRKFSEILLTEGQNLIKSFRNKNVHKKSSSFDLKLGESQNLTARNSSVYKRDSQLGIWRSEFSMIRTLGFVMAVFILCWLFFFMRYTFCGPTFNICSDFLANSVIVEDLLFWIGYFNSMVNPFLYNYTNKDFQRAFKKLLKFNGPRCCCFGKFGKKYPSNMSSRKTTMEEAGTANFLLQDNIHVSRLPVE
ncbi:octopamine receptor beta-3R-like isoform X2 [Brachionus plicatilis]|uniref:Octopamine receptor beta-3R-like isoform X2 n=1 Tax=Brachionus plicatilis TaxID=10195 RepID=A0A3M7RG17_BRAPC|nr:octopamine receptor beta-3R-like isoform X2 [Brachionus plicatilis]